MVEKFQRLTRAFSTAAQNKEFSTPLPSADPTSLTEMLGELGLALIFSSNPVNDVIDTLHSLAVAYERPELRIVCLPTYVLIEDPTADTGQTSLFPANNLKMLRLDQAGDVQRLVHEAAAKRLPPDEVLSRLNQIKQTPARFGFWRTLLGHMLLTVGFGMVMNPTLLSIPVYVALGLIIGVIVLVGSRIRTLSFVLPVVAAFAATALVGAILATGLLKVDPMLLIAPSVISLLPGMVLVTAAVELTRDQLIAGSSRLLYGFTQLAMLAFGVFLGISLLNITLTSTSGDERLGAWAPWLGIVLVGFGYYLYSVAPKHSLLWVIFALTVAYAGQLLGVAIVGSTLSGMIGAIIAIPVIFLVSHLSIAPPATVMLLCAYWVLVPGSMGFIGVTEVASQASGASNTLLQTLGAIIAIALGMVIGAGLSRDTGAFARAWHEVHRSQAS